MNSPRLSLCMIVRDESARLGACLESVRGLADEIVVVDTGSRDGTGELARRLGARVVDFPWRDDFSAARNAGLDAARGAWILALDADETLDAAARASISALLAPSADRAYSLVQRSPLPGGAATVAVGIVRLFPRRDDVRFERPIHEQVNTSLERAGIPVVETAIEFRHSGYADGSAMGSKRERNQAIIEAALAREPDGDPNLRYFHANGFFDAGDHRRAAEEYLRCERQCAGRRRKLEAAARLKAAECLALAGEHAASAALLPLAPSPDAHPLACRLAADHALREKRPADAEAWLAHLLAAPDIAHLPPVALAPLKCRALGDLAELWAGAGRKDVAVRVMRLALDAAQGRRPASSPDLGVAYRAARGPVMPPPDAAL